jgi:ThiF family
MAPERRYPVLMAFCVEALERTIDDAIEIYDRALGGADRAAQRKREDLERRARRDTQATVRKFVDLSSVILEAAVIETLELRPVGVDEDELLAALRFIRQLAGDKRRWLPGVRPNESGYWIASENWHPIQLGTRGKLDDAALKRKVVIIGAGAFGSALAELLVRTGLADVTVLDADDLQAGNLVRHTLGLQEVGGNKAFGVAGRLNRVTPHAMVEPVLDMFPPSGAQDLQLSNSRTSDTL